MKKRIFIFIFFLIYFFSNNILVNAISVYPIEINNKNDSLYISNQLNEEIIITINSKNLKFEFEEYLIHPNQELNLKFDITKNLKIFNKNTNQNITITFKHTNINYLIEIENKINPEKIKIPIMWISSSILIICTIIIIKKF